MDKKAWDACGYLVIVKLLPCCVVWLSVRSNQDRGLTLWSNKFQFWLQKERNGNSRNAKLGALKM